MVAEPLDHSHDSVNLTYTSSPCRGGGLIYEIDIPDTTIRITAAVAIDTPIDPVVLHQSLMATLHTAEEKAAAWGGPSFLKPEDDPYISDTILYPDCVITLMSENTSRTSRKRLKYGRVIWVLKAMNRFLYEERRWFETTLVIYDNRVLIATGSIITDDDAPHQVSASFSRKRSMLEDAGCSLHPQGQS